jgi:Sensors of blue-light using FAD
MEGEAALYRLLYISTARQSHAPATLEAILRTSRRNNAAAAVTGLLLAGGRRFLQILEGPEESVRQTYERICRDPRHVAPVILKSGPVATRLFANWAMGFQQAGTPVAGGSVSDDVAALVAPIEDPVIKAYFAGFALQHAA